MYTINTQHHTITISTTKPYLEYNEEQRKMLVLQAYAKVPALALSAVEMTFCIVGAFGSINVVVEDFIGTIADYTKQQYNLMLNMGFWTGLESKIRDNVGYVSGRMGNHMTQLSYLVNEGNKFYSITMSAVDQQKLKEMIDMVGIKKNQ